MKVIKKSETARRYTQKNKSYNDAGKKNKYILQNQQ